MNLEGDLARMSVGIVSHIYTSGPSTELEDYLKHRTRRLVFVGHPFSYAQDIRSFVRVYEEGSLVLERKAVAPRLPELGFYLKDTLFTFRWLLGFGKLDLYIGVDNLNAFCGLCLKAVGRAERVVFYTIDYIPRRFGNRALNAFYHWMDRFCVRHCDYVWNLSPAMAEAREKRGISKRYRDKQITVPIGTDLTLKPVPFEEINRNEMVFLGHLREGQGVELLIDCLPAIAERVPNVKLVIIGGGPLEAQLRKRAQALGLENRVEFTGFVEDHQVVGKRLSRCAIGLAPYVDEAWNYTRYTDPGKPKEYLAAGLPVIITKVPRVAFEIEGNGCGVAIDYDAEQLVEAATRLLSDEATLRAYRDNALRFARRFDWNVIFADSLGRVLNGNRFKAEAQGVQHQ